MDEQIETYGALWLVDVTCRMDLLSVHVKLYYRIVLFFMYNTYVVRAGSFYPRDAMLARVTGTATCLSVRLSVCLSVCPSRAGIVSKRRKLAA